MASWPPPHVPRAQISQLPYSPGLDGLRALAVMAVMVYHANHAWLGGGFLGVEVFFVISGYLITLLIIAEHERTDRVRLGQFWLRRARRLLPALFAMLIALATYLALFNRRPQGRTRGDFLAGFFYGSNWYQIVVGQSYADAEAFAPLRHLWSLAVEEQFYLIWPVVMVFLLRKGRERLPKVAFRLAAISLGISLAMGLLYVPGDVAAECSSAGSRGFVHILGRCISVNDTLYLSTITRCGGLLLGAAFAMVWRPVALMRGPMQRKGHLLDVFAVIALGGLTLMTIKIHLSEFGDSFGNQFDPWLFRGGFFVTGVLTLVVIAAVVHRKAFMGGLLGNPVLRYIGTRSYGLYLFHWPIYQIIRKFAGIGMTVPQFIVAILITVPVTELSYHFVETPIRRGTWRRGQHRRPSPAVFRQRRRLLGILAVASALIGFAGVSLAVARNVCVGDVECSVQDGGAAAAPSDIRTMITDPPAAPSSTSSTSTSIATSGSGDTPASTSTTAAAPETTVAVAPPTTVAAPVSGLPPYALGESVMLGAQPILQAAGFNVNAEKSRNGPQMAELVESLRAQGAFGDTVVIQIGTNGTIDDDVFARIMAQLPPDLTPHVVFLTVHVPRKWNNPNNEKIRALPAQYTNVTVADWEYAAGSIKLCADQIHIACGSEMAQYYANLIFDSIGRHDLAK